MISLSVVVPVYSGEQFLDQLGEELDYLRSRLKENKAPIQIEEVIFVDDGAIDDSGVIIDHLAEKFSYVTALHLSRNFGQHPATIAGILHTAGDWVVTMDEDMQHPPSRIPDLLATVSETGADIVYGRPESKVHQSLARDFTSRNYKTMIERLTGNKHIRKANSFRLIRGTIARAASGVCGHDTYFDIALSWFTQRIETRLMSMKDARFIETGTSGYKFRSLLSHARRLAFSSQIKVLRGATVLGFLLFSMSLLVALIIFVLRVVGIIEIQGWTSLMITICFLSGAIILLVGIIIEYISILVMRAHGKPLYFTVDRKNDELLSVFKSLSLYDSPKYVHQN